jgi:F-type H+-transporting ATPase subunit alpha
VYLQDNLFKSGVRPAVDVGISVSRVGSAAQVKAMKTVSGTLKLELAQYRSLEAFAMFASDLDAASRRQLARGARLTELLKQPQYSPYSVVDEVVVIWAGTTGQLDDIAVGDVRRFEGEMLQWLHRHRSEVLTSIESTGQLSDDNIESLKSGLDEFKELFKRGETTGGPNEAPAQPLAEGTESRETVTREVRSSSDES